MINYDELKIFDERCFNLINLIWNQENDMKKNFYIDYPQEHIEGHAHSYRCVYCKVVTTTINGRLEGHLPSCEYRIAAELAGFECEKESEATPSAVSDDFD